MEHDVDPRTGLTAEQIDEGWVTEIKRPEQEFNMFVPRPRSEVSHSKKITARWEIPSRSCGSQKKACCIVCPV